jgi:hypothetical protein
MRLVKIFFLLQKQPNCVSLKYEKDKLLGTENHP